LGRTSVRPISPLPNRDRRHRPSRGLVEAAFAHHIVPVFFRDIIPVRGPPWGKPPLVEAVSSRHKPRGRPAPIRGAPPWGGSPSDMTSRAGIKSASAGRRHESSNRWDRLFRRHRLRRLLRSTPVGRAATSRGGVQPPSAVPATGVAGIGCSGDMRCRRQTEQDPTP
jgi:hypothetical protein